MLTDSAFCGIGLCSCWAEGLFASVWRFRRSCIHHLHAFTGFRSLTCMTLTRKELLGLRKPNQSGDELPPRLSARSTAAIRACRSRSTAPPAAVGDPHSDVIRQEARKCAARRFQIHIFANDPLASLGLKIRRVHRDTPTHLSVPDFSSSSSSSSSKTGTSRTRTRTRTKKERGCPECCGALGQTRRTAKGASPRRAPGEITFPVDKDGFAG
jgi:hypothetical protein